MEWYKFDITDMSEDEYDTFYSLMSPYKQERVDRFRFVEDKKRTVAGEMLARKAISEMCNVPVDTVRFNVSPSGKPFAINLPIEFSISHSGNYAVCAISERPVGIDIEKIRAVDLNIAQRICSDDELIWLFGHKPKKEDFLREAYDLFVRFFGIWTAKEAYFKRQGEKISDYKEINVISILSQDNYTKLSDRINGEYIVSIV